MNFFDPVPLPIVIGMMLLAILLVGLMCLPNAWVVPFLRLFGIKMDEKDPRKGPPPPSPPSPRR